LGIEKRQRGMEQGAEGKEIIFILPLPHASQPLPYSLKITL